MERLERIVFFGTPEFAVPCLDALVASGRSPVLVVSQPPRPAGRGRQMVEPPIARRARELGLPLEQPARVRDPAFLERIRALEPDLAVVVAFGQIFPRGLLDIPRAGCINLHASLLPRWRGAAPIQAAIVAGDPETGVSIQRMEEGLDSGPVYAERRTPIGGRESAGALSERLSLLGAELLSELLPALEAGLLSAAPQDESGVTVAPKWRQRVELDLKRPAVELARLVRAANPEPGAVLSIRGEAVKVLDAVEGTPPSRPADPGVLLAVDARGLALAAGEASCLVIEQAQRPGGRPVTGRDLANGLRLVVGEPLP